MSLYPPPDLDAPHARPRARHDPSTDRLDGGFRERFDGWIAAHVERAVAVQHVLEVMPPEGIFLSAVQCSLRQAELLRDRAGSAQSTTAAPGGAPWGKAEGKRKAPVDAEPSADVEGDEQREGGSMREARRRKPQEAAGTASPPAAAACRTDAESTRRAAALCCWFGRSAGVWTDGRILKVHERDGA